MHVALGSLTTFAFNLWIQKCNPAGILVASAFALFIIMITLSGVSTFILEISRTPDGLKKLFNADSTYGCRWGTLYNTLREGRLSFVPFLLVVVVVRSAITSFGQGHGLLQLCAMIVVDLIVCISESHYHAP
jgi:hypothetical protein